MNFLAVAPWWISAVVAVSVYIILKYGLPAIPVESDAARGFFHGISQAAPFVALILFIPAPISAYHAFRKRALLEAQKETDPHKDLSWEAFETLVADVYRGQGYAVSINSGTGTNGGIDLILKRGKNVYLAQCKQWRAEKVGIKVVREMYEVMKDKHAQGVIIVTFGLFSQEAKTFAIGKSIDLIEGRQLSTLIDKVKTSAVSDTSGEAEKEGPVCPACGAQMVLRFAKKGSFTGTQFWGCSAYPKCKKIVNIERKK